MGSCRIHRTSSTLGAVVTGVRLAALTASEWQTIESVFHEHALLIFPDQHLDGDEQVAFALRFGELEHIVGDTGLVAISNQRSDGSLLEEEDDLMQVMIGNQGWHSDSSYMSLAAKASMLSAHVVPPTGGQTEWADMRAAYEALDDETRERIAGFSARHSLRYSQARIGHTDPDGFSYGFHDGDPPLRPLVKIHPVSGRPSLFIGRHAYGIPGLSAAESEKLLAELLEHACRPPRTYLHAWQPGDIAVWDNRCVLHRARPYDHSRPRIMKHTRIAGERATEWAPSPPEAGSLE